MSIIAKFLPYYPLFLVFMSGFGFSVQSLIIKHLSEQGYHGSFQLIIVRGGVQAFISSCIVYYNKTQGESSMLFGDNRFSNMILFLRAAFGFGSIAFGFLAIEFMPVGDASVLLMQSPILSAILGYFILGEPWRLAEFSATILSMIGVILITRPPFIFNKLGLESDRSDANIHESGAGLGPLFGCLAAVCAGCAFTTVRLLGTSAKMPWANVSFSASLAQFLLSFPCLFLSGQSISLHLGWSTWILLLTGGVIGTVSQIAMTIGTV